MKNYIGDICTLNLALVGCVNENLISASLDYDENDKTNLKLIFRKYTIVEEELAEDIIANFEGMCGHFNISAKQIVFVDEKELPLKYIVYHQYACPACDNRVK